jgi:hypothetical protein
MKYRYILGSQIIIALFLLITSLDAQKINEKKNIVYITRKGNKYHRDSCRYLSKSKIAITIEEARKYYKPCLVCKPDKK